MQDFSCQEIIIFEGSRSLWFLPPWNSPLQYCSGSLLCGPWIHDIVGYCLGYRWDFVNKCIMESPNENGYGTDFCRFY